MKREQVTCYFCGETGAAVRKISDGFFGDIQEIRLRINRPIAVSMGNTIRYVTADGQLTYNPETALKVSEKDLRQTFEAVCGYSLHSFKNEINEGFVTVNGGHRVGLCGTSVIRGGTVENVKNISSLNFRIAREIKGCAEELCGRVFSSGLQSLLIAGPPSCGKTTVLRDLTRIMGGRYKVAVIDERGELAACCSGVPQNDIGANTDVFDGYDKPHGIMMAVRVMSPQLVVCDEIGSEEDMAAVKTAANSGVYTAATIHAASLDELERKGIGTDIFGSIAFLNGLGHISRIVKRTVNGYA